MILFIKFTLFFLSFTGYLMLLTCRYKLRLEFAPLCYCAFVSNVMFIAGLLNCMGEMAFILYMGGLMLLCWNLRSRYNVLKEEFTKKRNIVIYMTLVVTLLYFSWLLRGSKLLHYDNFSHWGIVVKAMLRNNRMPNFKDTMIGFKAYPLGSSLLIYYVCKVLGTTEACFLWGQMLILVSSLFTLAVFIKKKNWWCIIPLVFYGIYALTINISVYDLLVDTLLPLVCVAPVAVILYYRDEPWKMTVILCGILPFILNIKNSGIFFYFVSLLFIIVYNKQYILVHWRRAACLLVGIPLSFVLLWKKHVALVFTSGATSKHALSIQNYIGTFKGKSIEDIIAILTRMKDTFFQISNRSIRFCLLAMVIALVGLIIDRKNKAGRKHTLCRFFTLWSIILAWQISLLAMYIFSMPIGEALNLAGYARYEASVVIYAYGILGVFLLYDSMVNWKGICFKNRAAISFIILIYLYPAILKFDAYSWIYKKRDISNTDRYLLVNLIQKYNLPEGKRYLIYSDSADYYWYMGVYDFWTTDIYSFDEYKENELEDMMQGYDYLLVVNQGEEIRETLLSLGYECPNEISFVIDINASKVGG